MKLFSNLFQRFLLLMLALSVSISIDAYDFEAANEDGVVIYYNIISETDKTCAVTFRSQYPKDYYSYALKIPETVTYSSISYKVTAIANSAFRGCSGITSITIPSSVTTIGGNAFNGCSGMTSVEIPSSVTAIGMEAFYGCKGLNKVIVKDISAWCRIGFGNSYANPLIYAHHLYSDENTEITKLTIPSSVTTIGSAVFYGCTGLTSVVISNSVTTIGESAFYGCSGMTSVEIPSSVTTIANSAFRGCSGMTSITIPSSVTTIGYSAFFGCSGMTSVEIPSSVTAIGESAFYNCISLTSITIPSSVTTIGGNAFNGCSGMTSVEIPSSVTAIGNNAFNGCSGLTSVTIPSSVTAIGESAFYDCSNLREILFNSSPRIGSSAFSYDNRISYIYINATTAPYMGTSSFTDEVYQYAYLHIPMGCYEEFSSAYGWRNFNRIKEDLDVNGTTYYTSLRIKQSDLGYVDQYVKVDEVYTFYIAPEGNRRINTVLFNGEDVTEQLVDGYYTTPIIKGRSVLSVSYEEINGVKEIPVSSLKVYGYNGVLYIKDADDNAPLNVYDIDGKLVYNATIANGEATIQLPSSEIYAVKVGERTIKVAL